MIDIACNIDDNYIQHCAVTLISLFSNNRESRFTVHIIARDFSQENKNTLTRICHEYENQIKFYAPHQEQVKGFFIRKFSKRISIATYYRCLLSDILPDNIDRVLYLDCDIVVAGDILPLWNISLENVAVAAVEDIGCHESERYDILKYPMDYSYFNAGVLLVNLAYWREHHVVAACLDYFRKYPERILFNDQDLLNSVLYKNKKLIDLKWNAQDGFYRNPKHGENIWVEQYMQVLRHPVIIHYTNRKPWEYDSQHPLRGLYFKYLDLTPWKGWRPNRQVLNVVRRFFHLLPFYLRIRKPKYIRL